MKRFCNAIGFMLFCMFAAMPAWATPAELTLPTTVDLSDLFPYAAAIVTALVGLIVIRKAIKLTNRS